MEFQPPIATLALPIEADLRALEGGAVRASLVLVPSLIIGELLIGSRDRGDQTS